MRPIGLSGPLVRFLAPSLGVRSLLCICFGFARVTGHPMSMLPANEICQSGKVGKKCSTGDPELGEVPEERVYIFDVKLNLFHTKFLVRRVKPH